MAAIRVFRKEREKTDYESMSRRMNSPFDPSLRCRSGVQGVVTYTDNPARRFGLGWSLLTERFFISGTLISKAENKTLKEGDWIEAVVVWMQDNWVVRSFVTIQPPVQTKVIHAGHQILLEVNTTVVVGAVFAKYAVCYSELFGRVVFQYEPRERARLKLEWGAMFNAKIFKPRDPDEFGREWTVSKLLDKCDERRQLPQTIRFVRAAVGELIDDQTCTLITDDGDNLVFEYFVYTGSKQPRRGDRFEAFICRDTGDKMSAVGVRDVTEDALSSSSGAIRSMTTKANNADEDTAQLLDDLENMWSDCSTSELSVDEKVESDLPPSSASLTNQQNVNSLPAESSIGCTEEENSEKMTYNGTKSTSSQAEEASPIKRAQSEARSTSQTGAASGSSEGNGQSCRAKELLKRVIECSGVVELIASEDALLMRDLFFFERNQ